MLAAFVEMAAKHENQTTVSNMKTLFMNNNQFLSPIS